MDFDLLFLSSLMVVNKWVLIVDQVVGDGQRSVGVLNITQSPGYRIE
jgi:hypothetical protein